MLKPEHLRTLQEVVRRGSFAAAANRLGYTASAVSQQIAALEKETGVQLFQRSARSVVPTEAAEVMVRHSDVVLSHIERLLVAVADVGRHTQRDVRIGVFPSLGTNVLPEVLAQLAGEQRLAMRVELAEPSHLIRELSATGGLDAAIVYQVGQSGLSWPSTVTRQWMGEDPFRVVFPQSWAGRLSAPYPAEQLADLSWILHHPGSSDAAIFDAFFARWDLHPRVVAHSDDFHATLALVGAGLGAALVPDLALRDLPDGVVVADVTWFNISRSIFALVHPARASVGLGALLEGIASSLARELPATTPSPELPA